MVYAKAQVPIDQNRQFCNDRLKQCGYGNGVVHAGWNVANPELQRREKMMRPDIPPEFAAVLHTVHLHKQVDVALKLLIRLEVVRYLCTRKFFEDLTAI